MASRRRNLFDTLGLSMLPWVVRIYLVLLFIFASLALLSSLPIFAGSLRSVAVEGLKMLLAALLGALSQFGDGRLRSTTRDKGSRP
jgi:hypothetical protein